MNERLKVRYANGFEALYKPDIAKLLEKRGSVKIIGEASAAPKPEKPIVKIDRKALIKEIISAGLATKEECVELSDSELADLAKEQE